MRYALHTATNYAGTPLFLRGCLTDWNNFLRLDKELGIREENTISLIAERYTKALAVEAVSHFASIMEPGDVLLGSNSSHGTQVPDNDGDEQNGFDEALLDNNGAYILDDEVAAGLRKFKPGTLVVAFLDNCHAGTMDRGTNQPNWHLMNSDVRCNAAFFFGCKEDQTAADAYINNEYQGALTYYALKVLRECDFNITYQELLKAVNNLLSSTGYRQIAQLAVTSEQLLNKKVFHA